eukprot:1593755-Prymnesium_polylepis.1
MRSDTGIRNQQFTNCTRHMPASLSLDPPPGWTVMGRNVHVADDRVRIMKCGHNGSGPRTLG